MIAGFAPIGLDELVDRASLMTRVDRKYVLPATRVDDVLAGLVPHARALEIDGARDFGYASTYYDDEALTSFHLSAQGRRRRFKVRSRTYAESGRSFVEVKTRGVRGTTVKHRLELAQRLAPWDGLPRESVGFVEQVLADFGVQARALLPVLHTAYRRSTLLVPASGARVTLDSGLTWSLADGDRLPLRGVVVLETKSGAGASLADRQLWAQGVRPTRISKYGTGLCALDQSLRGNRWRPVVRRHFPSPTLLLTHDRTAA